MVRMALVLRGWGYWLVLGLIAASYLLCVAQQGSDPSAIAFVVQLASVVVVLWIAEAPIVIRRITAALLAVAVAAAAAVELTGARGVVLELVLAVASALTCLLASSAIIAHRVRVRRPGGQTLIAAASAYLLVGLFFTFVYNIAARLSPETVLDGPHGDSLRGQLFFSYTTLTTVGYGNVVPVGPVVESVAIAEAITGQLFLIVAVASMISAGARRVGDSRRRGDDVPADIGREPSDTA